MALITALFALLACSSPSEATLGRTLAMVDDGGVVALTWDGDTATVYRDGRELSRTPAATWDAAMWSVDLPAYGQVTAPHAYGRALGPSEVQALSRCDWAPSRQTAECGISDLCDCGAAAPSLALN